MALVHGIEASRFAELVHAAVESERSQASAARRLGISTSYVSKVLRNEQEPAVHESTLVSVGDRLGLARAVIDQEFTNRDAAFGLEADIDDDEIVLDGDHGCRDHAAFHHAAAAEAFVEKRREIVAAGIH